MSFKINDGITWVGKTDWEIRKFHGNEYSTFRRRNKGNVGS